MDTSLQRWTSKPFTNQLPQSIFGRISNPTSSMLSKYPRLLTIRFLSVSTKYQLAMLTELIFDEFVTKKLLGRWNFCRACLYGGIIVFGKTNTRKPGEVMTLKKPAFNINDCFNPGQNQTWLNPVYLLFLNSEIHFLEKR